MEINVVENLVVPETPRTSDVQKIMVYMPYASHSTEGIAKFDSNDFMFTPRGVSLRHSLTNRRVIVDFVVDPATGKGTIVYNDNTKYSFTFPTIHEDVFRNEITKTIEFAENSFLYDNDNDVYYLTFSNDMTKQSTSEYLIQIEETVENGYDVVFLDTFKGNDGSLIISAALPFDGRVTIVDSVLLLDLEKLHNAELNLNIKNGEGRLSFVQKRGSTTQNVAYQGGTGAIGGATQAGFTQQEFNNYFWDSAKNEALHGGKGKDVDGNVLDDTGHVWETSFSFAFSSGENTRARARGATAQNLQTQANGPYSNARGVYTTASGKGAETSGNSTEASGDYSRAGGRNTKATKILAVADGDNCQANAPIAYASGSGSQANHDFAWVRGVGLKTSAITQSVFGQYNKGLVSYFEVGNGTSDSDRKTAFAVMKDGRAKVQTAPREDDDVVRWGDIKNGINNIVIVDNLPTSGISLNSLYLVPLDDGTGVNKYIEYIYRNKSWEIVGTTGSVSINTGPIYSRIEAIEDVLKDNDGNFVITKGKWSELVNDLNGLRTTVGSIDNVIETRVDEKVNEIQETIRTETTSYIDQKADEINLNVTNRTTVIDGDGHNVPISTGFSDLLVKYNAISAAVTDIDTRGYVKKGEFKVTAEEVGFALSSDIESLYYKKQYIEDNFYDKKATDDKIREEIDKIEGADTSNVIDVLGPSLEQLRKLTGLAGSLKLHRADGTDCNEPKPLKDSEGHALYYDKSTGLFTNDATNEAGEDNEPLYEYRIEGFADKIHFAANTITINTDNFKLDEDGNVSVKGNVETESGSLGNFVIGKGLFSSNNAFDLSDGAPNISYLSYDASYIGRGHISAIESDDEIVEVGELSFSDYATDGNINTAAMVLDTGILNSYKDNSDVRFMMLTANGQRNIILPNGFNFQQTVNGRVRSSAMFINYRGDLELHNAALVGDKISVVTDIDNSYIEYNGNVFTKIDDFGITTAKINLGNLVLATNGLLSYDEGVSNRTAAAVVFDNPKDAYTRRTLTLTTEFQGSNMSGVIGRHYYKFKITSDSVIPVTKTFYVFFGNKIYDVTIKAGTFVGRSKEFTISAVHTNVDPDSYGLTNPYNDPLFGFGSSNKQMTCDFPTTNKLVLYGNVTPGSSNTLGEENLRWTSGWFSKITYSEATNDSDEHKKNSIADLTDKYSKLFDSLRPVEYKWNNTDIDDKVHLGFIAQHVKVSMDKTNLSNLALYKEWSDTCGLNYNDFIAMCVYEIQKLKKRVAELENK